MMNSLPNYPKECQKNSLKQFFLEKYDLDQQIQNFRNINQDSTIQCKTQNQQNIVLGVDIKKNKLLNNLYVKLNKIEANMLVQQNNANYQPRNVETIRNVEQQLKEYKNLIEIKHFKNSCGQITKIKQKLQKLIKIAQKDIKKYQEYDSQLLRYVNLIQDEEKNIQKLQAQIFGYQEEINLINRKHEYQKSRMNIY